MLSEGGEENSIYHAFAACIKRIIKCVGTARATIKSGQKDTEASTIRQLKAVSPNIRFIVRGRSRCWLKRNLSCTINLMLDSLLSYNCLIYADLTKHRETLTSSLPFQHGWTQKFSI